MVGGMAQGVSPKFKPQYHKNKTKQNKSSGQKQRGNYIYNRSGKLYLLI
jgi:hypothetical protein